MAGLNSAKLESRVFESPALEGSFRLRRTKAMDTVEIGLRQASILKGLGNSVVNRDAGDLAYVIAVLSTVLVDPKEYDWDEVLEVQDILDLYNEWNKWNMSFRKAQS